MDFVYDAYTDGTLDATDIKLPPIPAPPLNLPAFTNYREDLTRKFSGLILKNLQPRQQDETVAEDDSGMANAYARASLVLADSGSSDPTAAAGTMDAAATRSQSVLGTRLIRVLNSSNFDSSLRNALSVLQGRIDEGSLDERRDSSASTVDYAHLTATGMVGSIARRRLRGEVESDLLRAHFRSLKRSAPVVRKLKAVKAELDALNAGYEGITGRLGEISQRDDRLRCSVDSLAKQRNAITIKKELLNSFKRNFTLNHYEEHRLANGDINDEFLDILAKAKRIYGNCEILLSLDNPKIGMDLMSKMGRSIDLATQRISKFLKLGLGPYFESVALGSNDIPSSQTVLHKTLAFVLHENRGYFDEIVDSLVQTRSKAVVDDLLTQINGQEVPTRAQQNSTIRHMRGDDSRPLILSSYDSKRFLGDLLAFVHNVLVNERELLDNLFDPEETEAEFDDQGLKEVAKDILDRVVGSLARPFKSVFERIIHSETKLTVLQDIHALLDLYEMMFEKLVSAVEDDKPSPIVSSLASLKQEAVDRLFAAVDSRLKVVSSGPESEIEPISPDLGLPEWLVSLYSETMPLFDNVAIDDRSFMRLSTEQSQRFLKLVVDDVVGIVETQVKLGKNNADSKPMVILKLNCYDFMSSKLITIPIMGGKIEFLNGKIHKEQSRLEEHQFTLLLQRSGLFDMYNLVNMIFALDNFDDYFDVSIYQPIVENQLFTESNFRSINAQLEKFLPNALIDVQQKELMKLLPPLVENDVITNSSIAFVNFYYKMWIITHEYLPTTNGVPIFRWSDSHVATLLGCEEPYTRQKKDFTESEEQN
ncbi:unnamed protein product [Kuraishia capsulata CBS 1993]|uniref:Conserved oligomeric Golgi complex subunit 6 n=1 Tax=Kuraishia capsulata CBS 1993 TaxID=1382522 RepID=W6MJ46_9ASCO|nr:uncharacterized protein KUCA_T00001954001 [Kuraishia capsulata CBS 1993]CDK25983.1 unnamed protein product [Kuraishia capsulata CBS 1993]